MRRNNCQEPKDRSCVIVLASLLPCAETTSELTIAKRNTTGAGLNLLSTLFQIAPKSAIHAAARGENRRRQTWGAGERAWGCGWLCTLATTGPGTTRWSRQESFIESKWIWKSPTHRLSSAIQRQVGAGGCVWITGFHETTCQLCAVFITPPLIATTAVTCCIHVCRKRWPISLHIDSLT